MKVDLICIGSELLTGLVENTNTGYLSRRLWSAGIQVGEQRVIPDLVSIIGETLKKCLEHSDAVICTGGLGPTDDDLTREAVAGLLGLPLLIDRAWLAKIERYFATRGYPMPESNQKQARVIKGSLLLDNPRGTAPGLIIPKGRQWIVLLPGPPGEMQPMFEEAVLPFLRDKLAGGPVALTRTLKCAGLGESLLEERIKQQFGEFTDPSLSLAAQGLEVKLQLKAYGDPVAASVRLEEAASRLRRILGTYLFGENDQTLAGAVAESFTSQGQTLALAESCSGGLLADALTDIPGSSSFFIGSLVAYTPEAKVKMLGIDPALITGEGAVSEAVAVTMARNVRQLLDAGIGVGVTGIAGPESDSSGSPVGLVYIAAASPDGSDCIELKFSGLRRTVKERAVQAALSMLWRLMTHDRQNT